MAEHVSKMLLSTLVYHSTLDTQCARLSHPVTVCEKFEHQEQGRRVQRILTTVQADMQLNTNNLDEVES
jgi:hypothetical protein